MADQRTWIARKGEDVEFAAGSFSGAVAITGVTSTVTVGTFNSTTKGYGVVVNATDRTAVARFYADDNGAAAWAAGSIPDQRVVLGRYLFTTDQTGGDLRTWGLMGQVKSYNGYWNDEQVGGLYGYLELVTTASKTLGGNGISAGVQAVVENSGAVVVNTSHILAGVAAISKLTSDLTQTGKVAGLYVGIYDATNWSDATARAKWGYGLYINAAAVTEGINVGATHTTTAGYGVALARSGNTANVRVYSDDGGAALSGSGSVPDIRGTLSKFLVTADQTGGHVRLFALQGLLASYNTSWNTEVAAGVQGVTQLTTASAGTKTYGGYGITAGVLGQISTGATTIVIDTNHIFAGVAALSDMKGTVTQTGRSAGVYVGIYDTTNWADGTARAKWGYGLLIDGAAVSNGIQIGSTTAPVTLAAVTNRGFALETTASFTTASEADAAKINAVYSGIGSIPVALRVNLESNVKLGTWANAIYASMDMKTAGGITGLGGVICAELTCGAGAMDGTFGLFEGELICPANWTGTGPISLLYFNVSGATKANAEAYACLFHIQDGFTSGATNFWYDHQAAAPQVEEWVRVRTPSGVRYLALYDAVA